MAAKVERIDRMSPPEGSVDAPFRLHTLYSREWYE